MRGVNGKATRIHWARLLSSSLWRGRRRRRRQAQFEIGDELPILLGEPRVVAAVFDQPRDDIGVQIGKQELLEGVEIWSCKSV